MKTTFLNCRKEDRKQFRLEGRKHMESRSEDFKFWMDNGTEFDEAYFNLQTEVGDEAEAQKTKDQFERIGSFYDYGLAVDYVAPGTFERQRAGYLRYQLSYGGPSEEVRFYFTQGARECYKIEFVYLNWGTGVGFEVTGEAWAKWLFEWFNEVGTVEAEVSKALEDAN